MTYVEQHTVQILEDYQPGTDALNGAISVRNGDKVTLMQKVIHDASSTPYWKIKMYENDEEGYIPVGVKFNILEYPLCLRLKEIIPTISTSYRQISDSTMLSVDYYWDHCNQRTKVILSFSGAVLSALINIVFASMNIVDLERDEKEQYNLTEFVLVYIEAIVIYSGFFAVIYGFLKHPYTILAGLRMMRFNVLSWIRMWVFNDYMQFVEGYIRRIKAFPRRMRSVCKNPVSIADISTALYMMSVVVFIPVLIVTPLLGAAGLLLRLRQFAWIHTVYVIDWRFIEWFKFFGFVNNIASMSMRLRGAQITAIERLLTGLYCEDEADSQSVSTTKRKEFYLLKHNVMMSIVNRKGKMIALLLIYKWQNDSEALIKILRNVDPRSCQ
eukprot:122599_1